MVRRVRFLHVHFWFGHDQYWMGPDVAKKYMLRKLFVVEEKLIGQHFQRIGCNRRVWSCEDGEEKMVA